MAKRKRSIRPEFWAVLIFLALLAYSLIANWWKEHALLGWVIVIILVALLAFSLYRFPAFRGLFIRTAKKAGESMVYGTEASGREPLSSDLREHILKRAHYKCENPDCKAHIKPHIHHIDGDNSNNNPRNLIALCPNCHTKAHHGVYSNSQLRNWVQRSWATFKSGRQRFR
jgi:hypothetical protein